MNNVEYSVALIPGDGIGPEVVRPAVRCVQSLGAEYGFRIDWTWFSWGSGFYLEHGHMMPPEGLSILEAHDAIFLGAVGDPRVPDVETLWGLLIPIRQGFEQYVNLRPIRRLAGTMPAVRHSGALDAVIVRENIEGEYSQLGGRFRRGRVDEFATQQAVFSRIGVERIARYAAELAQGRSGRVTSATKSNGIIHTMPFWDEIVAKTIGEYRDVTLDSQLVDALAAQLVLRPDTFDVIVASNLFGDILSDVAAAVAGSIGLAPSANLNPSGVSPSMFEPVHGSAPDIAGKDVANPVGSMWAAALMLEHLGETEASEHLVWAFERVLACKGSARDLGGNMPTSAFSESVDAWCKVEPRGPVDTETRLDITD